MLHNEMYFVEDRAESIYQYQQIHEAFNAENIRILKPEILKQLNDINLEKCLCYIDNISETRRKEKSHKLKLYFNNIFCLIVLSPPSSNITLCPLSINHFNQNKSCSIK